MRMYAHVWVGGRLYVFGRVCGMGGWVRHFGGCLLFFPSGLLLSHPNQLFCAQCQSVGQCFDALLGRCHVSCITVSSTDAVASPRRISHPGPSLLLLLLLLFLSAPDVNVSSGPVRMCTPEAR